MCISITFTKIGSNAMWELHADRVHSANITCCMFESSSCFFFYSTSNFVFEYCYLTLPNRPNAKWKLKEEEKRKYSGRRKCGLNSIDGRQQFFIEFTSLWWQRRCAFPFSKCSKFDTIFVLYENHPTVSTKLNTFELTHGTGERRKKIK